MVSKIKSRQMYESMPKETIPCSLCHSNDYVKVFGYEEFEIGVDSVLCKRCGFLFTNPRPTQEVIDTYYKTGYRKSDSNPSKKPKSYNEDSNAFKRAQWLCVLAKSKFKELNLTTPRILDVGCGAGIVLHAFRSQLPQSELYGIEPSPSSAKNAVDKTGAAVFCEGIDAFVNRRRHLLESFDLIILIHVLEHLYTPVEQLLSLREFLKPQGLLLLQVPTAFSPDCPNVLRMFHIAHVNQFSAKTLKNTLEIAGFGQIDYCPDSPRVVTYLCRKAAHCTPKDSIPSFSARELNKAVKTLRGKVSREYQSKIHPYRRSFIQRLLATFKGNLARVAHGPTLKECIQDEKILIIGAGPSTAELTYLPEGIKVFTSNRGLRKPVEGLLRKKIDVYLCSSHHMRMSQLNKLLPQIAGVGTNLFITDNPKWIRGKKELNGAYSKLIFDNCLDYDYLEPVLKPYPTKDLVNPDDEILTDEMRLLLYAIYYQAREIYLIGIDFWDNESKIDEKVMQVIVKKYTHLYSLSKISPVTRYIPYRNIQEINRGVNQAELAEIK